MLHITESSQLEQIKSQNPETRAAIDALLEHHQRTVSTITHEIRNPLSLVYSSLQLIEQGHPEVRSFSHWSDTVEDVEFIALLLNDLSTLGHNNACHMTSLSLQDLLRHIVLSFAASLNDTKIQFTSSIDAAIPPIQGDGIKLNELFLNLLQNAKDAVLLPGIHFPSISLTATHNPAQDNIEIQISDSGCGIPPEHMDAIFIPFRSYKTTGTGLGLPIARQVASLHKGTLSVSSELGVGTIFTVCLPSLSVEQSR